MDEFLFKNYSLLLHSVEAMATISGIFSYKKYKDSVSKYFIWFLFYLMICDSISGYKNYIDNGFLDFLKGTVFATNHWWSTSFWKVGAIVFFSFYYFRVLKRRYFKNIIKICGTLFFVFCLVYISINWNEFFYQFFPIISVLGALVVFLCTVFYFIEILQSERILTIHKSLSFYISVAIFIWWLIITPLVFYDIYHSNDDWNFIFLKWQIYLFANIFMYSIFTFALIWCRPQND